MSIYSFNDIHKIALWLQPSYPEEKQVLLKWLHAPLELSSTYSITPDWHSVKAGMQNGMEYGTEYGMTHLELDSC